MEPLKLEENSIPEKYKKLFTLIESRFSLSEDSLIRVRNHLNKKEGHDYDILKGELRKEFKVSDESYSLVDPGWDYFKKTFKSFCEENRVDYSNFQSNMIEIGKQKYKLFKLLYLFYLEEENFRKDFPASPERKTKEEMENLIRFEVDLTGRIRLPKNKKLYLVVTVDPNDIFMCSTGNTWSSCTDLSSGKTAGLFWAGVPGLFVDPNRIMVYITDKTKKEYYGIESEKAFCRSFFIKNNKNKYCAVKWYPFSMLSNEAISSIVGYDFGEPNELETSLYPVDFLKFKNNTSCFPYQDTTTLKKIGEEFYLSNTDSGISFVDKDGKIEESFICSESLNLSLDDIVEEDKEVSYYFVENRVLCSVCECEKNIQDMIFLEGEYYCFECDEENNCHCSRCGSHENISSCENLKDGRICSKCFNLHYLICEGSGETIKREESIFIDGEYYSISYANKNFKSCSMCDELHVDDSSLILVSNNLHICEECYVSSNIYDTCDECGEINESDSLTFDGFKKTCKKCIDHYSYNKNFNLFLETTYA